MDGRTGSFIDIMINRYSKKMDFNKNILIYYCRFIIGCVFIYASFDKIVDPLKFSDAISSYEISSLIGLSWLDNVLALSLPFLELILGLCLLFGVFLDEAINFIIFLMIFFIIMLSQAYFRGVTLSDCGCGLSESTISGDIIRDFILLFICLLIKFRRFILGPIYER